MALRFDSLLILRRSSKMYQYIFANWSKCTEKDKDRDKDNLFNVRYGLMIKVFDNIKEKLNN